MKEGQGLQCYCGNLETELSSLLYHKLPMQSSANCLSQGYQTWLMGWIQPLESHTYYMRLQGLLGYQCGWGKWPAADHGSGWQEGE